MWKRNFYTFSSLSLGRRILVRAACVRRHGTKYPLLTVFFLVFLSAWFTFLPVCQNISAGVDWGAERRVKCVHTREGGPPSAPAEIGPSGVRAPAQRSGH